MYFTLYKALHCKVVYIRWKESKASFDAAIFGNVIEALNIMRER